MGDCQAGGAILASVTQSRPLKGYDRTRTKPRRVSLSWVHCTQLTKRPTIWPISDNADLHSAGAAATVALMPTAHDVARHILSRRAMTAMKMQKLAYYSQAWHLARKGAPLFVEPV
jgi:hypothetical protein